MAIKIDWINYLQQTNLSKGSSHPWIVKLKSGQYELFDTNQLKVNRARKLKLAEIVQISESIFKECTLVEKNRINSELATLFSKRTEKYEKLSFLGKVFAILRGYKRRNQYFSNSLQKLTEIYNLEKKEAEWQAENEAKKLQEEAKAKVDRQNYLRKIQESFNDDISKIDLAKLDSYPVEELQAFLTELDPSDQEKATTLFLLYEKVSERYIAAENYVEATKLRLQASQMLSSDQIFESLNTYVSNHSHPILGAKLQPLGAGALKNHVIHAEDRKLEDGTEILYLEAKLNHHTREKLNPILTFIKENPEEFLNCLPSKFCQEVILQERSLRNWKRIEKNLFSKVPSLGNRFCSIEFKDIGVISVGASKEVYCDYNRLVIELDRSIPEKEIGLKLYTLLTSLGLGELAHPTRSIDQERIKVFQLYRAYFPSCSYSLERDQQAFETSLKKLKKRMITESAQGNLQELFNKTLYKQTVYPGFTIWAVQGLGDEIRAKGAIGLMLGVGSQVSKFEMSARSVASMLKLGALSSQDRIQNGILVDGISSATDIQSGGGDSVFTRLVLKKWTVSVDSNKYEIRPINRFPHVGKIQMLFDLKVLDRVGYGLKGDCFGAKKLEGMGVGDLYDRRKNLIKLAEELSVPGSWGIINEICIKHRLPPEYSCGLQVQSEEHKEVLVNILREEEVIIKTDGVEQINGISLEQFINVGKKFKASSFSNA